MANLAYRKKERISLETARAINNQAQLSLPA
jgi:hypothetical protein